MALCPKRALQFSFSVIFKSTLNVTLMFNAPSRFWNNTNLVESNLTFLLHHFNGFVKLTCAITKIKSSFCTFWPIWGFLLPLLKFVTLLVYFNAPMNFTFETTHNIFSLIMLICSNRFSSLSRISLIWWLI